MNRRQALSAVADDRHTLFAHVDGRKGHDDTETVCILLAAETEAQRGYVGRRRVARPLLLSDSGRVFTGTWSGMEVFDPRLARERDADELAAKQHTVDGLADYLGTLHERLAEAVADANRLTTDDLDGVYDVGSRLIGKAKAIPRTEQRLAEARRELAAHEPREVPDTFTTTTDAAVRAVVALASTGIHADVEYRSHATDRDAAVELVLGLPGIDHDRAVVEAYRRLFTHRGMTELRGGAREQTARLLRPKVAAADPDVLAEAVNDWSDTEREHIVAHLRTVVDDLSDHIRVMLWALDTDADGPSGGMSLATAV